MFGEIASGGASGNTKSVPDVLYTAGLAEYSGSIVFAIVKEFRGLRREPVEVGFDILDGDAGSSTASIEGSFLAGELEEVMEG